MDIGKYAIAQKGNVNIKSGKHKQEGPDNVNLEALVMSGVRNLVLRCRSSHIFTWARTKNLLNWNSSVDKLRV
jgi:hypothetical protein